MPGGYGMHLEITWTSFFFFLFTTFMPNFPPSNSKILSIINTDTSHMSLFNHSKELGTWLRKWSLYPMCYVSRVTCHMSLVRCHLSHINSSSFLQSGEVSLLRICYQQGLSGQVLDVDTQYLPILASSRPFLVISH